MSNAVAILIALVAGLLLGMGAATIDPVLAGRAIAAGDAIGGLWLNGLKMTIVPLIVALLITGIARAADAARAGRLTTRAIGWFIALLWSASIAAALLMPLLLDVWPLDAGSAEALRRALGSVTPPSATPGIADFLSGIVPSNPVAAAAGDAILPLIVFTTVFAFAITRLPTEKREPLTGFFEAAADALVIVIGWVLLLAPIGVFALSFGVGARAGSAAFGALAHYVVIVSAVGIVIWLAAYVVAVIAGRVPIGRFLKANVPVLAVAVSTRSSLASLPAMLRATEALGVPEARAGVVLPLAVAIFRVTGPPMNLAVALYIAHWMGVELGPTAIAAGIAAAAITTLGAVSIPGEASFITSIAPIALAMGLPIEPLALLIAVEAIPDIFRTLGNVTMDVAVTTAVARTDAAAQAGEKP